MKKLVLTLFLLGIICSFRVYLYHTINQNEVTSQKNNLNVSPFGSDTNSGSEQEPLKTIQKAADLAASGTTVYVREGTYQEQVIIQHSGQKKAPIVFRAYPNEKPIIDGSGLEVLPDHGGIISIQDKNYITIKGFEIKNYQTDNADVVPIAISISGIGKGVRIVENYIHHIETNHNNGNAHGIAVYGTKAPEALEDIVIAGNVLEDLKLGASESLVINGNVNDFTISNNVIRRNNNIGIDVIGFEGVSPIESYDQARNGLISNNEVSEISSWGNPAYGKNYSAGGIYVDGGKNIIIESNKVYDNDYGIEAASEHYGKKTSDIIIRKNIIYKNRCAGIAIGGYDSKRGGSTNNQITDNILYKNDTNEQETGQLLMQYNVTNNLIQNNVLVAGNSHFLISSLSNKNSGNKLNRNLYYDSKGQQATKWIWNNHEINGFSKFKSVSSQDSTSEFSKPKFVDEQNHDFRIEGESRH